MKKLLLFLLLILIGCSEPEPINYQTMLNFRYGVYYTKDTNQPYSGPVFSLYDNGQLLEELVLKDGKKDGPQKTYYQNGQLKQEGTLKNGLHLDGHWKFYYENGQLRSEQTYKNSELNGKLRLYNENGQLQFEGTYEDDKLIDFKRY